MSGYDGAGSTKEESAPPFEQPRIPQLAGGGSDVFVPSNYWSPGSLADFSCLARIDVVYESDSKLSGRLVDTSTAFVASPPAEVATPPPEICRMTTVGSIVAVGLFNA
jgi:hypothetical protein